MAIGVAGWAVWKSSKYHSKSEDIQEKVSNLPCTQRKTESDELKSFEKSFDSMIDTFEEVCKWSMCFDADAIDNLPHLQNPLNPIRNYLYVNPSRIIKKDESGADKEIEL